MTGSRIAFGLTLLAVPFALRRRRAVIRILALLLMLVAFAQVLTGCGGSNSKTITTSTVTVTGLASTGQTHSATITLVVE